MNPPLAHPPTDDDVDALLLKAVASRRISRTDLDALVAHVMFLRAGGVRPGLIPTTRTDQCCRNQF